jgi:hypothetical protein
MDERKKTARSFNNRHLFCGRRRRKPKLLIQTIFRSVWVDENLILYGAVVERLRPKPVSIGMVGVLFPPDFGVGAVDSDDACWAILAGDVFVLNPASRRLNSFGLS